MLDTLSVAACRSRNASHRSARNGVAPFGRHDIRRFSAELKRRSDYQKKMGAAYTLEGFHDALLADGDPPMPLPRPLIL
jgi:hypothetical protein